MRVAINVLSVSSGGGLRSIEQLIPALERQKSDQQFVIVVSRHQKKILNQIPSSFEKHNVSFNPQNIIIRTMFEQFALPFCLWYWKIDWLYSLGNLTTILSPCKVLLLIENANPYSSLHIKWTFKENFRLFLLNLFGRISAWKATRIRFLSENSKIILIEKLRIDSKKAFVAPQGVTDLEKLDNQVQISDELPDKFILNVSNIGPHKNLEILIDAYVILRKKDLYNGALVIAGAPISRTYHQRLLAKCVRLHLEKDVIFWGWTNSDTLSKLYYRCDAFVFPSIEETFGMPVLEAISHGAPTVVPQVDQTCSNLFIPYYELCRDAAVYFNPFQAEDLAEKLFEVLSDKSLRQHLKKQGIEQVRRFSWDDIAGVLISNLK
jgi:glycosyltransferase involved in cell wall biosynthesis